MSGTHTFLVFSGLFFFTFPAASAQNACDGPYVTYQNDQVIVRSVNSDSKAELQQFPLTEIDQHPLTVHFSNRTNWDFTVSLRKKIVTEPAEYGHIDKIFAVSDIEGQFGMLRNLLVTNGIMDSLYRWTFGKNHLVVCGDLFDRGKDVTAVLWLLYKLEDEAKDAGGQVHTLLGNHDIMNLAGDFRYVSDKYTNAAKLMGVKYADLYTKNTELGRWLISRNLIEKIDGNLCLHAGISSYILGDKMNVDAINTQCRPYFTKSRYPDYMGNRSISVFFGEKGPFWYRGYFIKPGTSQSTVNKTLDFYQCHRIVVGHTISGRHIAAYYHFKVIGIDVDVHGGDAEGIIIQNDEVWVADLSGGLKPIEENSVQ